MTSLEWKLQVIYKTRNQLTHEKSGAHWQVPQSETKGESIIMFTPMNMYNGLMRTKKLLETGSGVNPNVVRRFRNTALFWGCCPLKYIKVLTKKGERHGKM